MQLLVKSMAVNVFDCAFLELWMWIWTWHCWLKVPPGIVWHSCSLRWHHRQGGPLAQGPSKLAPPTQRPFEDRLSLSLPSCEHWLPVWRDWLRWNSGFPEIVHIDHCHWNVTLFRVYGQIASLFIKCSLIIVMYFCTYRCLYWQARKRINGHFATVSLCL